MTRILVVLLCGVSLTACSLDPKPSAPTPAVPTAWPNGPAYRPLNPVTAVLGYRDVFQDVHLQALLNLAMANNQDLRAALANVEIARAQYRVQRAAQLPRVDASGSITESHGPVTLSGTGGATRRTPETSRSSLAEVGLTGLELDLFGRLQSLSRAAQEQYLASEDGAHAARLTLIGQTASAYLTLATDRSLLSIARDTLESAQKTLDLTRARLTGGVSPRTDVRQAESLLEQAKSDVANLTTQVAQDRNALDLLVGATVTDADLPNAIEAVDGQIAEVPAGLESSILLRRPDVSQAEHRLRDANAQIGAARAAFFPTISLTALFGAASPQLSALFGSTNSTWQFGGSITQPIFSGGANLGNLAVAKGERDLAVAQYQKAIQSAFRDVANALARQGTIRDQLAAQEALTQAASDGLDLEMARYRGGIDPYLNALDAQRTLYAARRSLAATRLVRATNLVSLYQSLGGDPALDAAPPSKPN